MGIKDNSIDYQRQRTIIAAHDFSCFSQASTAVGQGDASQGEPSSVGGNGTINEPHGYYRSLNAQLETLNRNIVVGYDGRCRHNDGTVITVPNDAFADVQVGDIIGYGSRGWPPERRLVLERTNTTVTVYALPTRLRHTTAQEYVVYRPMGVEAARFTEDGGQFVRHLMPIPSHWDTHDDLGVAIHFTTQGTSVLSRTLVRWRVTYDVVSDGELLAHGPHTELGLFEHYLERGHEDLTLVVQSLTEKIPASALDKGDWLSLRVELEDTWLNLGSRFNERAVYLCGIGLEWTPKFTVGRGTAARPYDVTRRDKW